MNLRHPKMLTSMLDSDKTTSWRVMPTNRIEGQTSFMGDKSISHRAVIFSALSEQATQLENLSTGQDVLATVRAFAQMGVEITHNDQGVHIHGVGLHGLRSPENPLDMGNSGTAMRLLAGLLSGQSFSTTLVGDESLSRRPMARIADPLKLMGAQIRLSPTGTCPITIAPAQSLQPIDYTLPHASAQIHSAIFLASLYTSGKTCTRSPYVHRDHTARMLRFFGSEIQEVASESGYSVCIDNHPEQTLQSPGVLTIPGDLSSAAFFIVAASIAEQGNVILQNVNVNPTRDGIIRLLTRMGGAIDLTNRREVCGEPIADLVVRPAKLHSIDLDSMDVALGIDEIPVLAIACACATGTTRIRGAKELRVKESDRIQLTCDILSALGVKHKSYEDGLDIIGRPSFSGGCIDAGGDHRIAMAAAVAAIRASDPLEIMDVTNVVTSFPSFSKVAKDLGLIIQ